MHFLLGHYFFQLLLSVYCAKLPLAPRFMQRIDAYKIYRQIKSPDHLAKSLLLIGFSKSSFQFFLKKLYAKALISH